MRWLVIVALGIVAAAIAMLVVVRNHDAPTAQPAPPQPHAAVGEPLANPEPPLVRDATSIDATQIDATQIDAAHTARAEILDDVRDSGPVHGTWSTRVPALVRSLHGPRTGELHCFAAGCTLEVEATVDGTNVPTIDDAIAQWQASDAYLAWKGVITVMTVETGLVIVFYPPPE